MSLLLLLYAFHYLPRYFFHAAHVTPAAKRYADIRATDQRFLVNFDKSFFW
ncbi:MAG: hypothetical protein LBS63_02900 [Prevotellaceae bacterium]|nr:hypothetical protein [Prevotellaceae bacterium]